MSESRSVWEEYASVQEALSRRRIVDSRTWGLEAQLDGLLENCSEPSAVGNAGRAGQNAARKERCRRATLRLVHSAAPEAGGTAVDVEQVVDARTALNSLEDATTTEERYLLRMVGEGYDYQEIAAAAGVAVGTLRVRLHRLRHRFSPRSVEHNRWGSNKQ